MTYAANDPDFHTTLTRHIPSLITAIAHHPEAEETARLAGEFSATLTDRDRANAAVAMILGLAKATLANTFGSQAVQVVGVTDDPTTGQPVRVEDREDVPPFVHAFQWLTSAMLNGDTDMAAATLATIPDEDVTYLLRSALELAAQVTRAATEFAAHQAHQRGHQ